VFEGFTLDRIDVGGAELRVRHGGSGEPILLIHGHPRTHATWHRVAPLLAERYTVVCPDLRGYGESSKPATTADHEPYSKRAMARDLTRLMTRLGHDRFTAVGHDRGCYVALRLALDHPERIDHLVVADGIPIGEALARCNARFAESWWHWFFLGNPKAGAERVISADPDAWYGTERQREKMEPAAFEDYVRAVHDPATVHAMCEDYRAGLGIDRQHDDESRRAGVHVACPTHFLWSAYDDMEDLYGDPLAIWAEWTTELSGTRIESGHHMAEEAPEELAAALAQFLTA
jgi:haloacetate dehalogenase